MFFQIIAHQFGGGDFRQFAAAAGTDGNQMGYPQFDFKYREVLQAALPEKFVRWDTSPAVLRQFLKPAFGV